MRIGIRAHDFGKLPAEELARRIAAKGLTCVQLAVSKAIAGLDLSRGALNPGLAWDRDEWDVALGDGAVYRIFHDRDRDAWFVDAIVD